MAAQVFLLSAAVLCALVGSADAASGKYCIDEGSTMLLVRSGANGTLEFGMSSWNARAHFFGVSGVAQAAPHGWRSTQDMNAADPADRCEALIGQLPDGGYTFSVTQAGRASCSAAMARPPSRATRSFFQLGRDRATCRPINR